MSYTAFEPEEAPPKPDRGPLYPRLLRLRAISPGALQRALLVEGIGLVAVILVLADIASAWTLLVLPLVSTVVVKLHDVVEVGLRRQPEPPRPDVTLHLPPDPGPRLIGEPTLPA